MASFIPPENRKPEEVALVSLFLTLNIFHTFFLLFLVLTLSMYLFVRIARGFWYAKSFYFRTEYLPYETMVTFQEVLLMRPIKVTGYYTK